MSAATSYSRGVLWRSSNWPAILAIVLVALGLLLGTTAHKAALLLVPLGVCGPVVLREVGALRDLDELQMRAISRAGLHAFMAAFAYLSAWVVIRGWRHLSFDGDALPASVVVALMLVVYGASYWFQFWGAERAARTMLLAVGVFWLAFVVLSHAGEPGALISEALLVPGVFLLSGVLSYWHPRLAGAFLLIAATAMVMFFHLLPGPDLTDVELARQSFVFVLLPLPLLICGLSLLASRRREWADETVKQR